MGALGVGDRAPGFTLRRTFDESVSLSDLLAKGPLLLAFYVFDFGPA
jgi:peroxiredoxin